MTGKRGRKKATNLTLHDDAKRMAAEMMEADRLGRLTTFLEQLIYKEAQRRGLSMERKEETPA